MPTWLKITLGVVGIVAAGTAAALWAGSARWQRATGQAVDSLLQATLQGGIGAVDFATFDQLPPPVAAYFRFALTDGQPLVKSARIVSAGQFNAGRIRRQLGPVRGRAGFHHSRPASSGTRPSAWPRSWTAAAATAMWRARPDVRRHRRHHAGHRPVGRPGTQRRRADPLLGRSGLAAYGAAARQWRRLDAHQRARRWRRCPTPALPCHWNSTSTTPAG